MPAVTTAKTAPYARLTRPRAAARARARCPPVPAAGPAALPSVTLSVTRSTRVPGFGNPTY